MSTIIYHTHHIVPRYRCKEIGIDPDFPENLIRLTEKEHGQAHYERWLKHKRKEDLWAAIVIGKSQIDGHSTKGKNNAMWGKRGKDSHLFGTHRSLKVKEKISATQKRDLQRRILKVSLKLME